MKIGILGYGVVGSHVVKIIDQAKIPSLKSFEIVKIFARTPRCDHRYTSCIEDILNDESIDTVVEVMGGIHPAYEYICAALKAKKHVVSANKAVIAQYLNEFLQLAHENGVSFCMEASVAGGIPWIKELMRVRRMDKISAFKGTFNGTTNYILDSMHRFETTYETALLDAKHKGYAESDPSADVDGIDIQNKCAISAAVAYGGYVDVSDIPVFGISSIKKEDVDYFKRHHLICKLMGQSKNYGSTISLSVCPVLTTSIMSFVGSNLNYTSCKSQHLGELNLIGQGAGGDPTASAIVSDLMDIENKCAFLPSVSMPLCVDNTQEKHHFYVREKRNDFHEELALSYEQDEQYIYMKTKKMTLCELMSTLTSKECFLAQYEEDIE